MVDNRPPVPKATGSIAAAAFRRGKSDGPRQPTTSSSSASSSTPKARKRRDSAAPVSDSGLKASSAKARKSRASEAVEDGEDEEALTRSPVQTEGKKRKRQSTLSIGPEDSGRGGSGGGRRGVGSGSGGGRRSRVDEGDLMENSIPSPTATSAIPSAIEAATSQGFVPARLSSSGGSAVAPVGSSSQLPLVFFQFPAKFDVAAFSSLESLSLPALQGGGGSGSSSKVVSHFELNGERFNVVEGDIGELNDLINLFPSSSSSSRGELRPGRPFTRFYRIVGDVQHSVAVSSSSGADVSAASHHLWPHSAAAVQKKERKAPKEGLRPQFRPVGFIQHFKGHSHSDRRTSYHPPSNRSPAQWSPLRCSLLCFGVCGGCSCRSLDRQSTRSSLQSLRRGGGRSSRGEEKEGWQWKQWRRRPADREEATPAVPHS